MISVYLLLDYVSVEAAGYSCLPNINRLMPKITVITKAW